MLAFIYSFMFTLLAYITPANKLEPTVVYQYCVDQGIKHPEIVTAQAIVETGWFKCEDCALDNNNIFGFNSGGDYISFSSWRKSVEYYKTWQSERYTGGKDYYQFLNCVGKTDSGDCMKYAEDMSKYVDMLKSIVKNHSYKWKK